MGALIRGYRFGDADQAALNVVVNGNWKRLHPRWNVQGGHLDSSESHAWVVESIDAMQAATTNPAIVHFNMGIWRRPWHDRSIGGPQRPHPYHEAWFEDLDRTAWAEWRPNDARPSRLGGIARRARRAGNVLLHGSK